MAIAKALDLDLPSMRVALSPFDTANDLAAFNTAITYRHLFHAASLEYEALGRLAPVHVRSPTKRRGSRESTRAS